MRLTTSNFSADDFRARFGEPEWHALTQRGVNDGWTGDVDADAAEEDERARVFTSAVEDSIAEINSRIADQLDRLETAPALMTMILADLVRARLYADSPTQLVVKRQSEARRILEEVAIGKRQLDPVLSSHAPALSAPLPVFSDQNLNGYKV